MYKILHISRGVTAAITRNYNLFSTIFLQSTVLVTVLSWLNHVNNESAYYLSGVEVRNHRADTKSLVYEEGAG